MKTETLHREHFFPDRDALFSALQRRCVESLKDALGTRQQATLCVSGGSTPAPLFKALSCEPLDWEKVTVALVDERWVDETHHASNAALVKNTLLQNAAAAATFVGMKNTCATAEEGWLQANAVYTNIPKPFDVLILGMGPDGHIASLFPNASGIENALDLGNTQMCCAIQAHASAVTGDYTERLSLTLHGIVQARQIIVLMTGEEKLKVYEKALNCTRFTQLPVSAVLQQQCVPVDIYWAP